MCAPTPPTVILTKVRTQSHTGPLSVLWIPTFVRMTGGGLSGEFHPKRKRAPIARRPSPNSNRHGRYAASPVFFFSA